VRPSGGSEELGFEDVELEQDTRSSMAPREVHGDYEEVVGDNNNVESSTQSNNNTRNGRDVNGDRGWEVNAEDGDISASTGVRRCWRRWNGVILGQLLSLLLTGTGVFSEALVRTAGVSVPGFQNLLMYVFLAGIYGFFWLQRLRENALFDSREELMTSRESQFETVGNDEGASRLRTSISISEDEPRRHKTDVQFSAPWYVYALIAFTDVQGNFLAVLAYRYTTISSATLLDCFSIPVVMFLSRIFLKVVYSYRNMGGVLLCIFGLCIVVIIDVVRSSGDESRGSNPALGDALVIMAATCYGISNVAQEVMVKQHDRVEYLFLLGSFGFFFGTIEVAIMEHKALADIPSWPTEAWLYIAGYVICLFGMYSSISKFLEYFDAAFLNISLLSSDVWSVLAGHLIFHENLVPLYFVALVVIVSGVLIYNSEMPKPAESEPQPEYSSSPLSTPAIRSRRPSIHVDSYDLART